MADDDLGRRLRAPAEPVSDADIEMALTRTRALATRRGRRRRVALVVAPTFAALATVIVIVVATFGTSSHQGSTPPTTTSPSPSPPSTGAWFRHVVGTSGSVDLSAVWVVRLTSPGDGSFDVRPADRFGTGTLHYDGSRGGWVVDVLQHYCGETPGVYRINDAGPSLVFTLVRDPCATRRDVLDDAVFAPLTRPDQLVG